ncbi:MAG: regulator SirB [Gammaproteobacteria bacterium]|nr:regulator SirB [Gammaproteobacteria bacterium]
MPDYTAIKILHVATVIISGGGFALRLALMLWREAWLGLRPVKVLPHINDTLLLVSGIALAVLSRQYPLAQDWLTAKLIALVVYILLGMLALKPRFAKPVRLGFGALALLVFAYIVSVALARQAWPW